MAARLPVTLSLALGALLLVILLGVSIGMIAAERGGFVGRIGSRASSSPRQCGAVSCTSQRVRGMTRTGELAGLASTSVP
jgi:hypothetical protein